MAVLSFNKIAKQFPAIFKGEILTGSQQRFVIDEYKEYFLPYYSQSKALKKLYYNIADLPSHDFTAIMTPFYSVMSKKSIGKCWERMAER